MVSKKHLEQPHLVKYVLSAGLVCKGLKGRLVERVYVPATRLIPPTPSGEVPGDTPGPPLLANEQVRKDRQEDVVAFGSSGWWSPGLILHISFNWANKPLELSPIIWFLFLHVFL